MGAPTINRENASRDIKVLLRHVPGIRLYSQYCEANGSQVTGSWHSPCATDRVSALLEAELGGLVGAVRLGRFPMLDFCLQYLNCPNSFRIWGELVLREQLG